MSNPPAAVSTDDVATYIQTMLRANLRSDSLPPVPAKWDTTLLYECNLTAVVLAKAIQNPISTTWDVEAYTSKLTSRCSGQNSAFEETLLAEFPPIYTSTCLIRQPCLILDKMGNCLFWYLPGILTDERKNDSMVDLKELERSFSIKTNSTSWRASPTYFTEVKGGLKPGAVTLSPAWFQQGHQNSHSMEVSQSLTKPRPATWLKKNERLAMLVAGIQKVIQPEFYRVGMATLGMIAREPRLVYKGEYLKDIIPHWKSPFNVISVISNRQTPLHRDNGASYPSSDILVALGDYTGGVFHLPGLGMKFRYDPGTVVGIAGRVLRHGADCPGNRACLAYYMRQNVLESLECGLPGWTTIKDIKKSIGL